MERFHIIPEAEVITYTRGVFKQAKVYHRGQALYVGHGSGFVRLYKGGGTGLPNTRWDDIDLPGLPHDGLTADPHGKLLLPAAYDIPQIEGPTNV